MAEHTYKTVQDLPDEYLECRDNRHPWKYAHYEGGHDGGAPAHWKNSRGRAIYQKNCPGCGGRKYFYVVRNSGEYIEDPYTIMPRDYYLPAPETRMQRNMDVRKEFVWRFVPVENGKS